MKLASLLILESSRLEHESIVKALTETQKYMHGSILDLGCGNQPYATLMTNSSTFYVAVDYNLRVTPQPHVCADVLSIPFKNQAFDTVVSTQVLEHVSDPFMMIREATRVLKPSGYLIITAPQAWPLHEEPYDFFRFTKYALQMLARSNGLNVITLTERGGAFSALGQLLSAVLYDRFGKRTTTRIIFKVLSAPVVILCQMLDKMFYYPKLTLGYVLVAQKQ